MKNTLFGVITSLKPYFFSLREIGSNVSLDIKIPTTWVIEGVVNDAEISFKIQDKTSTMVLVSIISKSTKEGYDKVIMTAIKIKDFNLEEEEKMTLFNLKVEELKRVFSEEPLHKLKEISFTKQNVRNRKSIREIGLGDEEGLGTNSEDEREDD